LSFQARFAALLWSAGDRRFGPFFFSPRASTALGVALRNRRKEKRAKAAETAALQSAPLWSEALTCAVPPAASRRRGSAAPACRAAVPVTSGTSRRSSRRGPAATELPESVSFRRASSSPPARRLPCSPRRPAATAPCLPATAR